MEEEKESKKVTDIDALVYNATSAVYAFTKRWMPMPHFDIDTEIMDQGQLRDAMGLRATQDAGDPWPAAEKTLLDLGFRWHWLGTQRVMFLRERDDYKPDTGWEDAEEAETMD